MPPAIRGIHDCVGPNGAEDRGREWRAKISASSTAHAPQRSTILKHCANLVVAFNDPNVVFGSNRT
jgi:hypothetical protein